jgi:hypothetical protein
VQSSGCPAHGAVDRHRRAAAIVITNVSDLAAGTSRTLVSQGAMIVTILIVVLAILQLAYAWAMTKGGVRR